MTRARLLVGDSVPSATLDLLLDEVELGDLLAGQGVFQRIRGFLTFVNIVSTMATILLFVAVSWLVGLYLVPLLKRVPPEPLMHLAWVGLVLGGLSFARSIGHFIGLLGCLGLVCSLAFSIGKHPDKFVALCARLKLKSDWAKISAIQFTVFLVWMFVSLAYGSALIGFFTILMLEAALGFLIAATPRSYHIGFPDEERLPRAMLASLAILSGYVVVQLMDLDIGVFDIFSTGALFVGAFVYFLGLLVISSKHYEPKKPRRYRWLQLLTIVSCVAALLLGTVGDVPHLRGISGTFFGLYLIEKYFELPWRKKGWAWAVFGFATLLYVFSLVAGRYPEYFLGAG